MTYPNPRDLEEDSSAQLRADLERLLDRERQMAELLGSQSPDRLLHDLRNLLNEVQLLRILTEDKM